MEKRDIDRALAQYKKDFGFSFLSLIDDPDKYQKKIKEMQKKPGSNEDTKYFSKLYDKEQIELYVK